MAKRTFLYEIHKALGATFVKEAGWELPERFRDPLAEYRAVRASVGILDRSYRGKLRLSGPDRVRFLNGMVTNDVKKLQAGEGLYAALLNAHGKVLADLDIYALEESFLLDYSPARRETVQEVLTKHIIADDVEVQDVTETYGLLSIQGPQAGRLLQAAFGAPPFPTEEFQHIECSIVGTPVRLIRKTWYTGEEGYELLVPWDQLEKTWVAVWEKGQAFGLQAVGETAFEILRVEMGVPKYGIDMDESTLALEAPLERAISLTKGCYVGQEYVARITYRGHVNRKLAGLQVLEKIVPRRMDRIVMEGKEVGWVTSAVFSPSLNAPIALGYLRREYADPGSQLQVRVDETAVPVEVVSLPFYRRPS